MPICAYPFAIKSIDESGHFEGIASTYNGIDQGGDRILPGAYAKTLAVQGPERPLLADHRDVIGTVRLKDSPQGLLATGKIELQVQKGREVLALMRAGAIRGLSIGYQAIKDAMVNGVREISEIRLFEVSAVPFPMDLGAQVTSVKSLDQITRAAAEFKHFRESFNKKWTPRWIQH